MKIRLSFLLLVVTLISCISTEQETIIEISDRTTYREWLALASHDIRLFPKFGSALKTSKQLEADQEFIKAAVAESGSLDSASRYYFLKACDYMEQEDLQTVMYRLNQAWLLNFKNPDVYRGFGWVYIQLEQYELAIACFDEGLGIAPNNGELQSIKKLAIQKVKEST